MLSYLFKIRFYSSLKNVTGKSCILEPLFLTLSVSLSFRASTFRALLKVEQHTETAYCV